MTAVEKVKYYHERCINSNVSVGTIIQAVVELQTQIDELKRTKEKKQVVYGPIMRNIRGGREL